MNRIISAIVMLFFSSIALTEQVFDRVAIAQAYSDEEAKMTVTVAVRSAETDPIAHQRLIMRAVTGIINSGKFNVHELRTLYQDRYLVGADIVVLQSPGIGNEVRIMFALEDETHQPQPDFAHHRGVANVLLRNHRDAILVDERVKDSNGNLVATIRLYVKPKWDVPGVTIDELTARSAARKASD